MCWGFPRLSRVRRSRGEGGRDGNGWVGWNGDWRRKRLNMPRWWCSHLFLGWVCRCGESGSSARNLGFCASLSTVAHAVSAPRWQGEWQKTWVLICAVPCGIPGILVWFSDFHTVSMVLLSKHESQNWFRFCPILATVWLLWTCFPYYKIGIIVILRCYRKEGGAMAQLIECFWGCK